MAEKDSFIGKRSLKSLAKANWMQGLLFVLIIVILISALYVPAWLKLSQREHQAIKPAPISSAGKAISRGSASAASNTVRVAGSESSTGASSLTASKSQLTNETNTEDSAAPESLKEATVLTPALKDVSKTVSPLAGSGQNSVNQTTADLKQAVDCLQPGSNLTITPTVMPLGCQ